MSQTSYTLDRRPGIPGMAFDIGDSDIVSFVANEALEPGKIVRVRSDGKVEYPTDDTGVLVGVVMYQDTKESSYPQGTAVYQAGDVVPVLRYGRIWTQFVSGTQVIMADANLSNGATVADRGKLTAQVTAANSVRTMAGRVKFWEVQTAANLALAEVAFP